MLAISSTALNNPIGVFSPSSTISRNIDNISYFIQFL